mgnify:CR=1 FL=1
MSQTHMIRPLILGSTSVYRRELLQRLRLHLWFQGLVRQPPLVHGRPGCPQPRLPPIDGRWLIPTAEVPLTSLVMGQIVAEEELPLAEGGLA